MPCGLAGLDQLLHRDVRHRLDQVDRRWPELAQRSDDALALVGITAVRHDHADHRVSLHLGRHERRGWCGDEREPAAHLVGRAEHEVAVEAHEVAPHRRWEDQHAAEKQRRDRVQLEVERGHDAEVAASAPEAPEQIGVLVGGRDHLASVRGHHLGLDEVVAGEPELPLEPAAAAAEREPGDAGRRHAPAGDGEAVLRRSRRRTRPR